MPKQIGWSNESNLLYQISQQITRLINVTGTHGGGSITGSGTTNYITKWTSSSAISNSLIYDNGSNVGIGTATPSEKLHVNGNILGSYIIANNDLYGVNLRVNGIYPNSLTYLPFYSSASPFGEIMRMQNNGNVLIGTTTDSGYKLNVNGTALINNHLYVKNPGNNTCYIYMGDSSNNYTLIQFNNSASNFYTIGNKLGGSFSFTNSVGNQDVFSLSSDATQTLSIGGGNNANFSGKVAIGGWSNIYTLNNNLTVIGATSIGTTESLNVANPTSVIFAVNSLTQGSIPCPIMTTAQIKNIASPVKGLMAFSNDDNVLAFYDGTAWRKVNHATL